LLTLYTMKLQFPSLFFALSLLVLATSCGYTVGVSFDEGKLETPEEKKAKLQELKSAKMEIEGYIAKLEKELGDEGKTVQLKNVIADSVSKGAFQHYIEVQGNVETDQNVLVNPEFSGVITSVRVEEGQRVSAGQVIATIDAKTLRKNMDELKTRLELAEDVYQRQKKLWGQKIGTEMQYLQAKNNKESLEKSLETLKSQLGQASVKAPISGIVEQLMANKGEMANPAMPVARIVNTSKMEVVADVSEAHLKSVKRGDVVTVDFPVLEESLEAKIDVVGAFIDPKNRTFKVQVKIPNSAGYLKPNVTAVVKIKDFDKNDAVFIPTNLIQQSATGDQYVLLLENKGGKQTVTKRIVKPSIAYKGQSVIEEGLSGGEQIITKGYTEVVPGEEVQLVKNEF